jgi:hypothetical protein
MTKLQVFPSTKVSWPDPTDSPSAEFQQIDNAHVVIDGNRMTIRKLDDQGRQMPVDVLSDIAVKGSGVKTNITGISNYMVDMVGLTPEESEVTIEVDTSPSRCLTS